MATVQTSLLNHLHRLMPAEGADADWLARFVASRDEAAFARLVSRHGPMVLRLCRRLVGDAHLAEDCFQATFLALARQAGSIRRPGALAAWLYGVAFRVAARARAEQRRRKTLCGEAIAECPDWRPDALDRLTGRELMRVFETELQRLPESYRLPIVLCCVEGLSLEEAAERLGWTAGSVKGRLERGRARLHARLVRRGLTLGLGLGAALAARGLAADALAPSLANNTVRGALAFACGSSTGISAEAVRLAIDLIRVSARPWQMLTWICMLGVGIAALGAAALSRPAVNDLPREDARPPALRDQTDEGTGKPAGQPEGVGDALPPGALFRIGSTRLQHGSPIWAVAAAPDGKLVASVSWDGDLSMWEMPTGRERYRSSLGRPSGDFMAFTPDAKFLLLNKEGRLCSFDVATGQISKVIGAGASDGVFSTDGKILTVVEGSLSMRGAALLGGRAYPATIRRLDSATGKMLSAWQFKPEVPAGFVGGLGGGVGSLDSWLSRDGTLVAMLETYHFNNIDQQTLHVHELASGKELHRLKLSSPHACGIAFVGDNKFLVTGSTDSTLRVWELATGKAVREWKTDPRRNVQYSTRFHVATMPDAQCILAQGPNGLIRWDWRTGKEIHTFLDSTGPIAFMDGGKAMAVQGWQSVNSLWVLDTATGKNACPLPRPGDRVAYSPDSRLIAWSEADALVLADAATGKEIRRWSAHAGGIAPLTFAPDGKTLASAGSDKRIRLWDVHTGTEIRSMEQLGVSRLAFSADGKRLAAAYGWYGEIWIWDPATGQQLGKWFGNLPTTDPAVRVAAVGDRKNKVLRLIDLANGRELHVLPGYQDRIGHQFQAKDGRRGSNGDFPPLFSPDGKLLLAGAEAPEEGPEDDSIKNGVAQFWDVASGKRLPARISGRQFIDDRNLAFSPDSRLLAITRSDCTICLMDTATGEVVRTLGKAEGPMTAPPVFTPNGRLLVTAVGERVQVWEVATGGELTSRPGHRGNVQSMEMSGNGRSVATVSLDHTILAWDLTRLSTAALPKPPLTPAQLASAWTDLTSSNAVTGRRAVETLCVDPAQAVALLRERLLPVKPPDSKQVARWIADLSSDDFEERRLATDQLERLGDLAEPALHAARAAKPPLEARRRITGLLTKLRPAVLPPEALRAVRGVQVLEMIATPQARKVLAVLAGGATGARVTQEAQASLERLER
jgi:RNA polymerase sigma factor (sigma-70 family)